MGCDTICFSLTILHNIEDDSVKENWISFTLERAFLDLKLTYKPVLWSHCCSHSLV
jgi:hypothetical protein